MSLQLAKANAKVLPVRSRIATSVCPLACFRSTMTLKRHNDTSLASKRARTVAAAATPGPTESPYPASFNIRGMLCTDHEFTVPLDHDDPQGPSITIFARELLPSTGKPPSNVLFFLQGGPGFESPRYSSAGGWAKSALSHFRVLLLDQRGTGKSTPVSTQFPPTADYLRHFKADSIVRDCEAIRKEMKLDKISILGQSFGGFCCLTYLSLFPSSLREVLITGGLAPSIDLPCGASSAYAHLVYRVIAQNEKLYRRFPSLKATVSRVVRYILDHDGPVVTPAGNTLSVRLLQSLGLPLLGSAGGLERMFFLFDQAFVRAPGTKEPSALSHTFLKEVDALIPFDTNPLYFLLHEQCYAQTGGQTAWAAERELQSDAWRDTFDAARAVAEGREVLFTGEMIFPFMLDDVRALRPVKALAEELARRSDWGRLYDPDVLARNVVPCAATAYYEDMYVDATLATETAKRVQGIRVWVTNTYTHGGLREEARVFERLLQMARNEIPEF